MSKFVFPLDKVSAPDTELLELGFPLYCGPKNSFSMPIIFSIHQSAAGHAETAAINICASASD